MDINAQGGTRDASDRNGTSFRQPVPEHGVDNAGLITACPPHDQTSVYLNLLHTRNSEQFTAVGPITGLATEGNASLSAAQLAASI